MHTVDETSPVGVETELAAVARHARVYLDMGAPDEAHRLLAPVMDSICAGGRPDSGSMGVLVTLLESCHLLGHHDHLAAYIPVLRELCETKPAVSADLWIRAMAVRSRELCQCADYAAALELCGNIDPETLAKASPRSAVALLLAQVQAHARSGDYAEAEKVVRLALEHASRGCDLALEGNVRAVLALLVKTRGGLQEALRLLHLAEELHTRAGDVRGAIMDHLNRGTVLNRLGRLEEARESFTEAHARATRAGLPVLALRASEALGRLAARQGKTANARFTLLAAWRSARKMGCRQVESLALRSLGELALAQGRLAHAACAGRAFRRLAVTISPEGDAAAECDTLDASIALAQGDWAEAEARARAAIEFSAGHGLPWEEALSHRLLGSALASSCRSRSVAEAGPALATASAAFGRARELFERMGESLELELAGEWLRFLDAHSVSELVSERSGIAWPPVLPLRARPAEDGPGRSAAASADDRPPDQGPSAGAGTSGAATASFRPPGRTRAARPARPDPLWESVGLVTQSPSMIKLLREAECLAKANINILVLGETGTGKELLARGLHRHAAPEGRPLLSFNCGTCPTELFDAELFGHVRGAFTGASADRPGLIRAASGGTLFLDEIGEMRPDAQARLLRFLDSGEVRPVGSDRTVQVRVRIISATNVPLQDRVAQGRFRSDLYYRLAGASLVLPPLRERDGDIHLLVDLFQREVRKDRDDFVGFSERALSDLESYRWPGNVRQLRAEVFRVAALSPGGSMVEQWDPPRWLAPVNAPRPGTPPAVQGPPRRRSVLQQLRTDREGLLHGLREAGGRVSVLARNLDVSRAYLYQLLSQMEIDLREFRPSRH